MSTLPSLSWKTNRNEDKSQKSTNLDNVPKVPPAYIFGFLAASAFLAYRQFGKRIKNSDWVTPQHTTKRRWIKGVVTSVGDADNFRLYHTPAIGYNWPLRFNRVPSLPKGPIKLVMQGFRVPEQLTDLRNETIHIRIAGVDAPEGAHFGKPGQLYYTEALEWLRKQILGKNMYCQLLRRDQYGRMVAHVHHPPVLLPGFLYSGKNLATEMLRAGWAVTYDQAGAEYGQSGKDGYLQREKEAKIARRGMWKDGEVRDTPAAYKRRHAEGGLETGQNTKPAPTPGRVRPRSKKSSLISRLRRWLR